MSTRNHASVLRWTATWAALASLATLALAEGAIAPPPDLATPPADAEHSPSGLLSKVLQVGTGNASPRAHDIVLVDYTGWTADGAVFDSSVARGKPAGLRLDVLIPGWREAIQLMVPGEKRRVWIPGELAYDGQEGKPQGQLVFDISLIRFERRTPPPAPADVSAPPPEAEVTGSGLASVVLEAGEGDRHPRARSTVTVHYTGWTTDGVMFDSSIPRGNPLSLPLDGVIKGWREGLQLMVVGETRRLWIPEKLAYKGKKGKPQGMLVFDVELVALVD